LHESSHDFGDAFGLELFGFNTLDVILVIFTSLLFLRSLRDCRVPSVSVFNAKSFDCCCGQLSGALCLCLATDEAGAVRLAAVARLWIRAISVDVVVKDKFFASFDFLLRKDPHAEFIAHHPLVDIAVRIARMVTKSAKVTFLCCIDKFAFTEGHKVKVLDALVIVGQHASSELRFVDDFTDILKYEVARSQISICAKAMTFLFRLDDGDVGILASLKALVLARRAANAIPDTLHLSGSIDAIRIFTTGMIGLCRDICTLKLVSFSLRKRIREDSDDIPHSSEQSHSIACSV
jgi:hypothetical protein